MGLILVALLYATSGLRSYPSEADSVAVTPNASDFANSSWHEVIGSTPEAWVLAGLAAWGTGGSGLYVLEVGVGGAGSESVIAAFPGCVAGFFPGPDLTPLRLGVPIDLIPAGSRVSVRLRKQGTDTTDWHVAVQYYTKPLTGSLVATTKPRKCTGIFSAAGSGTAWVRGGYGEAISSAAAALTLDGLAFGRAANSIQWEVDIAVGAAASESVIWTTAGYSSSDFFEDQPQTIPIWPMRTGIAAASRVAARVALESTSTASMTFLLAYYEDLESDIADLLATSQTATVSPSAAAGTSIDNDGVWVELIASAGSETAVVGYAIVPTPYPGKLDLSTGAAGAEADNIVDTWLIGPTKDNNSERRTFALRVAAGARLSARYTESTGSVTLGLKLVLIAAPSFAQIATSPHRTIPTEPATFTQAAAVTPTGTSWADSAIVEVVPSSYRSTAWALTGFLVYPGIGSAYEFDILTGESGSETVIATVRGHSVTNSGSGADRAQQFDVPIRIPPSTRVAIRHRQDDTSTAEWDYWFEAYDGEVATQAPEVTSFSRQDFIRGTGRILAWLDFYGRNADGTARAVPYKLATYNLQDPSTYTGGKKPAKIISIGYYDRALTGPTGDYRASTCSVTFSDLDYQFRSFLESVNQYALINVEAVIWIIREEDWRLRRTPLPYFRGLVARYKANGDRTFTLELKGWLDPRIERPLPLPLLQTDFPTAARDVVAPLLLGARSDEGSTEDPPVNVDEADYAVDALNPEIGIAGFGLLGGTQPTGVAAADGGAGDLEAGEYFVMATTVKDGVESDPAPLYGATTMMFGDAPVSVTVGASGAVAASCDDMGTDADSYRFYLCRYSSGYRWELGAMLESVTPAVTFTALNYISFESICYYAAMWKMADGYTETGVQWQATNRGLRRPNRICIEGPAPVGAEKLVILRRFASGDFTRMFLVDVTQTNGDGNLYFEDDQIDTDTATEFAVDGAPEPQGRVPVVYVGAFTDLLGQSWSGFVISYGVGASFVAAYQDGARIPDSAYTAGNWSAPGMGDFTTRWGANTWREVNGRRYWMLYVRGSEASSAIDGTLPIYVNATGIKTVNGAGGTAITSVYQQIAWLLDNWLLPDSPHPDVGGDWLDTPAFADGTLRRLDSTFTDTEDEASSCIPSGPARGYCISARERAGDLLRDMLIDADASIGINQYGQVIMALLPPPPPAAIGDATLTHLAEILDESLDIEDDPSSRVNALDYTFDLASDGSTYQQSGSQDDAAALAAYQDTDRLPATVTYRGVSSAGVAGQLAARGLLRLSRPERTITIGRAFHAIHDDLAARKYITHPAGVGQTGFAQRFVQIRRVQPNADEARVDASYYDLEWIDPGTTAGVLETLMADIYGGGSIQDSCVDDDAAFSGEIVPFNWLLVHVPWPQIPSGYDVTALIKLATAAGSVTGRVRNVTDASNVGSTTPAHTASTFTEYSVDLPRPDDNEAKDYMLLLDESGGAVAEDIKAQWKVRIAPSA